MNATRNLEAMCRPRKQDSSGTDERSVQRGVGVASENKGPSAANDSY